MIHFIYSQIANARDISPQRQECDIWDFALKLSEPDTRGDLSLDEYLAGREDKRLLAKWKKQKDGPAWIPATFTNGGKRTDNNVNAVHAVALDFDEGVDRPMIEAKLNGYRYLAHTSYSHHHEAPKWRVVIPLAEPVPPSRFPAVWEYFNRLFDGKADPSGKNPSHLYYLPAVPPGGEAHFQQFSKDGAVFEPASRAQKTDSSSNAPPGYDDPIIESLPPDVQALLRDGKPLGERSEAIFKTLLSLFRAGADDRTAFSALWDSQLGEKCREQGENWLWNEIQRARGKVAKVHGGREPAGQSAGDPDWTAVIGELAKLLPLEYDRRREDVAKELGVRVSTLDKEVAKARGEAAEGEETIGQTLTLEDPEPWPESVDGAELLTALQETFTRFVIMPEGGPEAATLWVMHTYCHAAAYASPIFGITSPERRCGKTTLQSLLAALVNRPLPTSNISPAAVFRCVERWHPTLLIDEADTFIKDNEELRGVINSGHTRPTAFVIRVEGEDNEPRRFSTWAPKAIALIGGLPGTLHDRAIGIPMRRKLPGEQVEKLREDRLDFEQVRRQCQRWAVDHLDTLKLYDPVLPSGLNDRAADNWRPLLAIADLAGGEWPAKAREAVKHLAGGDDDHEEARVKLLADIRDIFSEKKTDRLTSANLVAALVEMEDRPWPEWKNGKPLTQNQLARLLRPFKIKPETLRTTGERAKGYRLEDFNDAFNRYLQGISNRDTVTTQQPCGFQQNSNRDSENQCHGSKTAETRTTPDLSRCHGSERGDAAKREGNPFFEAEDLGPWDDYAAAERAAIQAEDYRNAKDGEL